MSSEFRSRYDTYCLGATRHTGPGKMQYMDAIQVSYLDLPTMSGLLAITADSSPVKVGIFVYQCCASILAPLARRKRVSF